MFNKQDMKSLASLNSSENLKLGSCAPVIIWTVGFMQDQETSEVLLWSRSVRCPQRSVPKEQAEEQTGAYKKPKTDPTVVSAWKKENSCAHACVCMHTHFVIAHVWCKTRNSSSHRWSWAMPREGRWIQPPPWNPPSHVHTYYQFNIMLSLRRK